MGLEEMTSVQEQTIPEFLGRDVIVQSQTGSGKTLSYLIPVLDTALKEQKRTAEGAQLSACALIIVPTRELCTQISGIVTGFGVKTNAYIGGIPIEEDLEKGEAEVVVGTPGRLLEIISRDSKRFTKLKYLILDEGDKLLGMGFEEKLVKMLDYLPKARITGLFSATIEEGVMNLSLKFLKNPASIKVTENIPENLKLEYLVVPAEKKLDVLVQLIENKKAIAFVGTCNCVDFYYEALTRVYGIGDQNKETPDTRRIYKIHGKMDQKDRDRVYAAFEADGSLLLCTDVAARGIDFKGVELVVHFDIPKEYTNIVHRSGRTARMGSKGDAMLFLMPNEKPFVNLLKVKGIDATEGEMPEGVSAQAVLKVKMDDTLLSMAVKAFVSYIRGYKEHIMSYILNYRELDFDGLAELFCLKRIPSMAELRNVKFRNYTRQSGFQPKKRRLRRPLG